MAESTDGTRLVLLSPTERRKRTGLLAWLARRRQHRTDQRIYTYNQEQCARARAHLTGAVNPGDRAELLMRLATATHRLGLLHNQVHGPQWIDAEDRSTGMSLLWEAGLYRALSDVEAAVGYDTPRTPGVASIEKAAGPVLDRMAARHDLVARTQLLDDLHDAVLPVVGKRAATAMMTLPLPAPLFPQVG